jgi:hypothetical protein
MRKLILLCSIMMYCFAANAQSFTSGQTSQMPDGQAGLTKSKPDLTEKSNLVDLSKWSIGYGISDPSGHVVTIYVTKDVADISSTNTVYYRIKMISGPDVTGWLTFPSGSISYHTNAAFSTYMTGNVVSISIDSVL